MTAADSAFQQEGVFQQFCAAGLWPGLGPVLTEAVAGAGITAPDQISAERLAELPGVGPVRAGRLLSAWIGAEATYDAASLLVAARLPIRWAARISETYDDPAGALRDDPWLLLELTDASLAEADRFAVSTVPGISRRDPRRGRALVAYTLRRTAREGHTVAPVEAVGSALAAAQVDDPRTAVTEACRRGVVASTLRDQPVLGLERYTAAEERCAEALARLIGSGEPFEVPGEAGDADSDLDETQQHAVGIALQQGVSVLTGGPGTGKSRTVGAVVRLAEKAGKAVVLAAPTGRAAKRLEELIGAPAATVHRLLGA
ncbi:MAG TPA: AAA family ATPase, partial [Mycobacteriales bacterium]|nr:AAA family ATPase [Mycobacteriales bacterium]